MQANAEAAANRKDAPLKANVVAWYHEDFERRYRAYRAVTRVGVVTEVVAGFATTCLFAYSAEIASRHRHG